MSFNTNIAYDVTHIFLRKVEMLVKDKKTFTTTKISQCQSTYLRYADSFYH